jgi:hypothetical protein
VVVEEEEEEEVEEPPPKPTGLFGGFGTRKVAKPAPEPEPEVEVEEEKPARASGGLFGGLFGAGKAKAAEVEEEEEEEEEVVESVGLFGIGTRRIKAAAAANGTAEVKTDAAKVS